VKPSILAGSSNLLVMRGVAESLAGRASYLTLSHATATRSTCGCSVTSTVTRCGACVLLHAGERAEMLDEQVVALPWS